jgi:dipeptidyl-peptidase 4
MRGTERFNTGSKKRPLFIAGLGLTLLTISCAAERTEAVPAEAPQRPSSPGSSRRAAILGPEASPISFERMARYPEPGLHVPRVVSFAPDGKSVVFLQSESQGEKMALLSFDLATASTRVLVRASDVLKETKPLSREEELRRERQRQRTEGVTDYRWAQNTNRMVIPLGGDLFLRNEAGVIRRLTDTKEPEIDPKLCASGERVGFVRGSELVSMDVADGREAVLTKGAPEGVTRGQSDFNGQEEFDEHSGFWWSPRCDRIAYLEVDERKVPAIPVVGYREGKTDLMEQRYPITGGTNPSVRAGIVDVRGKKTSWIALPAGGDGYLGRFAWSPDGKALWLQRMGRDQKRVTVFRVDAETAKATEMWTATSSSWIDFIELRLLEKSSRVVAMTHEGGHDHLEVRDAATGKRTALLTRGDWDVRALAGVDEAKGRVYFTATRDSALERQLYATPLAGGEIERVTRERGVHAIHMSRDAATFVDIHSANDRIPATDVKRADGSRIGILPANVDKDIESLRIRPVELVRVPAPGGNGTELLGALLRPRNMEAGARYPVVVMVYGGPGVQTVIDAWAPRLMWQHLADRGFVVFQLDNRGTSGRGPAFEAPIHKRLGDVELQDQLAGLAYLRSLPFVDGDRAGIYGHSYGGYMTILAMLKAPGSFKVGVAGSPVTDFRLYDTGYTERYMETPASNPAGYEATDLGRLAKNLTGKLFIIHALMDENVHFKNSAHLIDALVAENKTFDLLVFPGERHGYRSPVARRYAMKRVVDYLTENLR